MADVFDYLYWRGDVQFSSDPFNEVDNLVLAELAYTHFDGLVPDDSTSVPLSKVRDEFFSTHTREEILMDDNPIAKAPLLMDGMLTGSRFSRMRLRDYVNIIDEDNVAQMCAVTYILGDGTACIAFRGTDSTLVGWKEDFNMSYLPETVGQRRAVEYLNRVGSKIRKPIRVCGHSKGGNFAVYASAFCDRKVQDKIIEVYTNDGPGFRKEVMRSEEYKRIIPRVISIVPDTSVIGMFFSSKVRHRIVSSVGTGLAQHDALTWQVERNRFVQAEHSEFGKFLLKLQRGWLSKLDNTDRASFIDTLFSLFEATGLDTFGEMSDQKLRSAENIISAMQDLPREKRADFKRIFGELLHSSGQTAWSSLAERIKDMRSGM